MARTSYFATSGRSRGYAPVSMTPSRAEWQCTGMAPAHARQWIDAGYDDPSVVAEWTGIGIEVPAVARRSGSSPGSPAETAALWVEVEDVTPSAAVTAVNSGAAPVDIERVRRADPDWTRPAEPAVAKQVAEPDMGVRL